MVNYEEKTENHKCEQKWAVSRCAQSHDQIRSRSPLSQQKQIKKVSPNIYSLKLIGRIRKILLVWFILEVIRGYFPRRVPKFIISSLFSTNGICMEAIITKKLQSKQKIKTTSGKASSSSLQVAVQLTSGVTPQSDEFEGNFTEHVYWKHSYPQNSQYQKNKNIHLIVAFTISLQPRQDLPSSFFTYFPTEAEAKNEPGKSGWMNNKTCGMKNKKVNQSVQQCLQPVTVP
ncbi:hypothetical protein EGR_07130 [Echinococcus granulosus]|uniref:Uncharacterized protein n=1 Tax=Echinococcus granulosus TaxID=6210 RepID=W6UX00_ECHGR|nr:hypothetical protein EGR_07130 [Echinococcus granulosus]EUB58024.1 hypothetical protein EGR_07130 [Echinococcus granulosus]